MVVAAAAVVFTVKGAERGQATMMQASANHECDCHVTMLSGVSGGDGGGSSSVHGQGRQELKAYMTINAQIASYYKLPEQSKQRSKEPSYLTRTCKPREHCTRGPR